MDDLAANIYLYTVGISLGVMLSRYLYIRVKRADLLSEYNKTVVIILNTLLIAVGFVIGFFIVVMLYFILYLSIHGKF